MNNVYKTNRHEENDLSTESLQIVEEFNLTILNQNEESKCFINKTDNSTERAVSLINDHSNMTSVKKEEASLLTGIEEDLEKPLLWPQLLVTLAVASLNLHIGVVMAYSSVVIPILTDLNSTEIYMNKDQISLFSSIQNIGIILAAFVSGFIVTKIGQRLIILLVLPFGAFGWLLLAYTTNYSVLILSRIIVGIVIGACENPSSSFLLEIAHKSVRGRLMGIICVVRPMGFLYVSALGITNLQWQIMGLICGISTLILPFLILIYLPNSPRWLATHGRKDEARKSLNFYRGKCYNVEGEVEEIFLQLEQTPKCGNIFNQLKLFRNRNICIRFSILSIMMFGFHLTGNIVTISYSVSIYKNLNTNINDYLSSIIACVIRIMGSATNVLVADKVKRKTIILPAIFVSSLSMASLGLYFYLMQYYDMSNISWISLLVMGIYLYSTTFYIPSFLLLRNELLPTAIRAIGNSMHYSLMSLGAFIAIYSFPYMIFYLGYYWTFWIYVLVSIILFITILLLVPETKGKTLEEITDDIICPNKSLNKEMHFDQ